MHQCTLSDQFHQTHRCCIINVVDKWNLPFSPHATYRSKSILDYFS